VFCLPESLTVRDVLKRPYFQAATVYASEKALDRIVEWAHILEVTHVGQLLNGHELVLTTGLIWKDDDELGISFLKQIMDCNAAGLCIELGRVIDHIPERMKQYATDLDFPLILINDNIRYIDITRDIHSLITDQQRKKVTELEALSLKFNNLLLSGTGLLPLLRLYFETTDIPIAYISQVDKPLFVPPLSDENQQKTLTHFLSLKEQQAHSFGFQPIVVLNQTLGELITWADEQMDPFDMLALDRCATAVAQELMRTVYWEERQSYKQNQWIHNWLAGQYEEKEAKQYILSLKPTYKPGQNAVLVLELDRKTMYSTVFEPLCIQRNMVARSIFEKEGFFLIPTIVNHYMIYILLDLHNRLEINSSISRALSSITQADKQNSSLFSSYMGIGRPFYELISLKESYQTALKVIAIQEEIGILPQPFYSELHIYRVIFNLKQSGELGKLIQDYLGPIITLEEEKKELLLTTLKTYLMLNGAKRETAKKLYISRQTLYARLDKISECLGNDFMLSQKRFIIELAVYAYEYLALMERL
jgi:purine catabolism regulator